MNWQLVFRTMSLLWLSGCIALAVAVFSTPVAAQQAAISLTAGVPNSRTGPYAALAQLTIQAFEKGDSDRAAELARILERTWDRAEELGGDDAIRKRDPELFQRIDSAMDAFIKPIILGTKSPADAKSVREKYLEYIGILEKAD